MSRFADIQRVLFYARVSGNEGEGTGGAEERQERLTVQVQTGRGFCASNQLPAPEVFSEVESGGGDGEKRVQQRRLLASIRPGDLVLVCKLDRWSRDVIFDRTSTKTIQDRGGMWFSIGEPHLSDTAPAGRFARGMLSEFTEYEREVIRERMVGTRKRLRAQGYWVEGIVPLGYKLGGKRRERVLCIDPDTASIVRRIFDDCIRGLSIGSIVEALQVDHPDLRGWDNKSIGTILRNRVHLGQIRKERGSDQWIRGAHQPIIDEVTFAKAQRALDGRRIGGKGRRASNQARTQAWLLRSLSNCKLCGSRMGPSYRKHKSGTTDYYMCNGKLRGCTQGYLRVQVIDAEVSTRVLARLVELKELLGSKAPMRRLGRDFEAERKRLASKRKRTADLLVAEALPVDESRRIFAEVDARLVELAREESAQAELLGIQDPSRRIALLASVEGISAAWNHLTPSECREVIGLLASWVELDAPAGVELTWREPAELTTLRAPEMKPSEAIEA